MNFSRDTFEKDYQKYKKRNRLLLLLLAVLVLLVFFLSLMIGSSSLSFQDSFLGLFSVGEKSTVQIMQKIRLPRALSGLIAGMSLALSGLILQGVLDNPMASPLTLGVTNAAVLGANVSIIAFNGGVIAAHTTNYASSHPYAISFIAFLFSMLSVLLILLLARFRNYSPTTILLIGIALSAFYNAITTLLQYFANDTELSSAVYWSFGDLSRATMENVYLMLGVLLFSLVVLFLLRYQLNVLLLGEEQAKTLGVNTHLIRIIALIIASLLTAVSISFLGVISFVGLICPHIMRKLMSSDHRFLIPSVALFGSFVLLSSDLLGRIIMQGFSLPVGAMTSLFGAPFFLILILKSRKENA